MNEVDPKEFGILINKVEALTEQLAYTNRATEKNMDRLFIQMAAYLESNNQRHDENDSRAVRDKAELSARLTTLENKDKSVADQIKGAFMATKWIGVAAFVMLIFAVKGVWAAIAWVVERYFGN